MSALFSPKKINQLEMLNRIVVSPMCQYSAVDGSLTDWHMTHLGQLAMSGAGLLITEMTMVEERGRITSGCAGLYSDANESAMARVIAHARELAAGNTRIGIQMGHAGRKASVSQPWKGLKPLSPAQGGWEPIAPSALNMSEDNVAPRAMTLADIAEVRAAFVASARRAARIGFDALELHGAHGYLLHEFLSPISNQRTDAYGGSFANRTRFVVEVVDAVRQVWPSERPLGIRLSAIDWVDNGWDLDQSVELASVLRGRGCDFIDTSSGGISKNQVVKAGPGFNVPFAERIRRDSGLPTIAVGMITEPAQAEAIIANGQADFVALARGFLWNPRWVWHAAEVLGGQVTLPVQYQRARPGKR